jgi:tetratricopeptide (TPR) repeat protein
MICEIPAIAAAASRIDAFALSCPHPIVLINTFGFIISAVVVLAAAAVFVICALNVYHEIKAKRRAQAHLLTLRRQHAQPPSQTEDSVSIFKRAFRPVLVSDLAPHHLGIQRYHEFYLPRMSEEEKIAELLQAGRDVVISGKSGVGKSRTIFEMLTRFEEFQGFTVLRPCGTIIQPMLNAMYIPRNKYILILDNLDVFSEETGSVRAMLETLRSTAEQLLIFGTIRKESEDDARYAQTRQNAEVWGGFKEIELAPFAPDEIAEIIEGSGSTVEPGEDTDDTAITALISFRKLREKRATFDTVVCPESLKTILCAVKTLRDLNQPNNIVMVKRICVASLERQQILDEEIGKLVAAGFFDVADGEVICNDRILDEVLAAEMPLIETTVQLIVGGDDTLALWWAGVALLRLKNDYKALRCFEKMAEKYDAFENVKHYIAKLRDTLRVAPGKVEAPAPEPQPVAQKAGPEPAQVPEPEKEEVAAPQNYRMLEREPQAEIIAKKEEEPQPAEEKEEAPAAEPEPAPEPLKHEPVLERRRERIALRRDPETVAQLESWRKEITTQIENKHFRRAIENLHRLLAVDYNSCETHMALGEVYAKVNNRSRADYHMRKGVSLDKTNPDVHRTYARFLEGIGEVNSALHEYLMAGMLKIVTGEAELDAFAKCSELSRTANNHYVNFLSASYYTAILYCLGDRDDAAEFLMMIEKAYGQYPVVDYIIDILKGKKPTPLGGGDLEAKAARKICELVEQEMEREPATVTEEDKENENKKTIRQEQD